MRALKARLPTGLMTLFLTIAAASCMLVANRASG